MVVVLYNQVNNAFINKRKRQAGGDLCYAEIIICHPSHSQCSAYVNYL